MNWMPGWDSIESSGWWSNFYFWAGIIALLTLGVSEVVSHRYTGRKDELTEREQIAAQRRHDVDIAYAHERAAQLEKDAEIARKETAEAKLQLEQLRKQAAARRIKREEFIALLEGKPKLPVEIMFAKDDGEAFQLSLEIRDSLRAAKWEVGEPFPIPLVTEPSLSQLPSAMAVGGQPAGVTVAAYSVSPEEAMARFPGQPKVVTAYTTLSDALLASLGTLSGSGGHLNRPIEGTLRVIVGSKPPPLN
jgi:hypothetical protein